MYVYICAYTISFENAMRTTIQENYDKIALPSGNHNEHFDHSLLLSIYIYIHQLFIQQLVIIMCQILF